MITGIGTDIVEIQRIKDAVERNGERFLKRVFTEQEIAYCYKKKDPYPHLTARFAAKEAVIKALSSEGREEGAGRGLKIPNLKNIEILNHPFGKPFVNIISGKLFNDKSSVIHITLSHEKSHAIATVILERTRE